MGRPTSDDEGGFKTGGRSPTGDMMTLEEFLAEGMEKSSPKTKVSQSAMIDDYHNFRKIQTPSMAKRKSAKEDSIDLHTLLLKVV